MSEPIPASNNSRINPERWVDEHGDILYRYALMRVREPAVAEDLVQETFLAAMKAQERFAGQSSERSWLTGILKHKLIDYIRRKTREQPVEFVEALPHQLAEEFDENGYWRHDGIHGPKEWLMDDPADELSQQEFWKTLDDCLARLPSRTGQAFVMREVDDVSSEEICKVLNLSSTNLWVMLHRARMQLRHCLEAHWFDPKAKAK